MASPTPQIDSIPARSVVSKRLLVVWGDGMADFTAALVAEIASLESELEQDVRYVRLRELRRIHHLYGDLIPGRPLVAAARQEQSAVEQAPQRQSVRQPSPDRGRALAAAREYVASLGHVVPTREILEYLMANGIEVGGASPLNNLSAMISTSGAFQSHGRKGWTMKTGTELILTQDDYDLIVDETLNELTPGQLTHVTSEIGDHNGIPPDIDSRLLARSRKKNGGQYLTDDQLRALRDTFANSIQTRSA